MAMKATTKKQTPKKAAAKKKAPAAKSIGKQAADAASSVRKAASKAGDKAKAATTEARHNARKRASKLAISVVDLQKTTFNNAVKAIESLQNKSGKVLNELVENSSMMPREGKKVVEEWARMLKRSQQDLTKTMDKSFDLISAYFERIQKEESATAKSSAAKPAPKKTKVKRKPKPAAAKQAKPAVN